MISSHRCFRIAPALLHWAGYNLLYYTLFVAEAVDSRLEFPAPEVRHAANHSEHQQTTFAYTLLLSKPFPLFEELTLSLYLNPEVKRVTQRQCLLSYKYHVKGEKSE